MIFESPMRKFFAGFPFALIFAIFSLPAFAADGPEERASVIIAISAAGEESYAEPFAKWATRWQTAAATAQARTTTLQGDDKQSLVHLRQLLEAEPKDGAAALWLVLLGHGSFDGRDGKFNLPGDDLAASELAVLLKPFHRPVVVICSFSASGAFLKPLSAQGRVIVTATKSGAENNFSRFGGYLSETIADPSADIDKDGQTSLLEAWLAAARRVADFYKNEGRLATEHSLLDDNGDGLGASPEWFQGVRVVKKARDNRTPDGIRAHQIHLVPSAAERALPPALRAERDSTEQEIERLRQAKAGMSEDAYYGQLEVLLLRLARLYHQGGEALEKTQR
jgi:hypothetical protein